MKKFYLLALILIAGVQFQSLAQCGECKNPEGKWCFGDDPKLTREKWTIVSDGIKANDFSAEINETLNWLLTNVPNLNEALYINAIKFYEAQEAKETDPAKKSALEDKVIAMYDKRMQCYGEKPDVMERKARRLYEYFIDRTDKLQELYTFYNTMLDKGGENISFSGVYVYVVDLACKLKVAGKMTDEQIMEEYDHIAPMLEKKANSPGTDQEKWKTAKDQVDGILQGCVSIDCEFVKKNLGPKMQANPADLKMVKKIMAYMIQGKCISDPLFKEALLLKMKVEPDQASYILLAKFARSEKKDTEAFEYYNKALALMKDDEAAKKCEMLLDMATILRSQGKLSEARKHCYQAAEADASCAKDAYSMIGDMYMQSHSSCKGRNPLENRYVFLAAYDMYAKAGNSKGMANAKEQFPSAEDIFTLGASSGNVKEGSTVSIGCWIGATSTLRKR